MAREADRAYALINDRVRVALLCLGWETHRPEPGPATAEALCYNLGILRYLTALFIDRLGPEVGPLVDAGAKAAADHWVDPDGRP